MLALAPFNIFPVLFVTLPVLVWLIDGAGAGRYGGVPPAALTGYCFGLGYFVPRPLLDRLWFFVDADVFAWLTPFAVLGLPAYLSIFTALGFALARLLWTKDATRILALAASLTVAEWLRGHALTGFPGMRSLCAVRAAAAGADGVVDRPLGHDVRRDRDLREPRSADRPHA